LLNAGCWNILFKADVLIKSILRKQHSIIFRGGTIKGMIVPPEQEKEALQHAKVVTSGAML
jgi:hypothetical protein